MSSEAFPTQNDPLFGNAPSDLLREAAGTDRQPPSDPRFWQPPAPEELQARLDGYVVEAYLARGGMGAVYRGIQTSLERPVAIKVLPPQLGQHDASFLQRFKQEARAMAQLNHPGIVKVYDFGEMSDGTLFFIMEFIEGTDVGRMIQQQGRLSSAHAMAVTAHVCDALQYAHENGIIHRDIKPANIMVGIDGTVKVADFGLAKSFQSGHTSLTLTGHVMGTLHFMAPESLTLGSSVDHRADIYAVGVMLYQMLTGRLPQGLFELPSMLVPGLDPRFDPIIAAAMREDRNVRYQAIRDMRRALDAIITQPVPKTQAAPQQKPAAAPAQAAPPRPKPGQPYRRPPQAAQAAPVKNQKSSAVIWLIATIVVAGIGGIVWMRMGHSPLQPALASPGGTIGEVIFPTAQFSAATISEVFEYLQTKSRDLDPAKKGITILADEATRNSPVKISMDIKDTRLADLITYTARLGRMEVTQAGEAVRFTSSSSAPAGLPIGKPTAKLQKNGETIFPNIRFQDASLEEACEYIRVKGKDISGQHVNLIIGPDLAGRKDRITCDMVQIPLAEGLACIADVLDAEVAYLAESFYLQPRSTKPQELDPWAVQSFGEGGKVIIPSVTFQNASIEEAAAYLTLKSRDLDPRKKGMVILLDDAARRAAGKITFDSKSITAANAIAQIATVAGLEIFRVGDAARLRAPAKAKQPAFSPSAARESSLQPASRPEEVSKLQPSRDGGDPSSIVFINKHTEEVKIQFVQTSGKIRDAGLLKAGKSQIQRTFIGHVWLVTAQNGTRLGLVESKADHSTATIDAQGVQVREDVPPTRESQQIIPMVQFTNSSMGDAVTLLRQRAAEAKLNVQIDLAPGVDAKSGSLDLDAREAPLEYILSIIARQAGLGYRRQDRTYTLIPR